MCIVSDKIKFCTCAESDVSQLKHYWILYRFNKLKKGWMIGDLMFPEPIIDPQYDLNENTILARLNENDAFDVAMTFKNKDVLEVTINNKPKKGESTYSYSFQYRKKKWEVFHEGPFELANDYDEEAKGKIKSAIVKQSNTIHS